MALPFLPADHVLFTFMEPYKLYTNHTHTYVDGEISYTGIYYLLHVMFL